MNLVVIPFHDWKKCEREGFRTRDAHFMQEFERHRQVETQLIINRPISLAEMALLRRNWRPADGTSVLKKGNISITQVDHKTYTLDILIPELINPLRMKRSWIPYIFGQPYVVEAVDETLAHLAIDDDYALFLSAPLYAPLVDQLSPNLVAFDAQDNLLKHALYRDIPELSSYYEFFLERADFLSANSLETTTWFNERRPDAVHISNGVDKDVFSANQHHEIPLDMMGLEGPIVGYAGKMQEMFDVDLMVHVVKNMPDVNFVFIGQELNADWMKPLWQQPNAHYLGDKPYNQLPQYLTAFDVCVIPYNQQRQHGVDPIKFYEYVAIGKSVVTTNIGNVSAFSDYPQVRIPVDAAGFLKDVRELTNMIREQVVIPKSELPESYTWRAKADKIVQALLLQENNRLH